MKSKTFKLLSVLLVACMGLIFTSCSEDEEGSTSQIYSWGFDSLHSSSMEFLSDMDKIENAFKSAMGVSESDTYIIKEGSSDKCDKEIRTACDKAYKSLEGTAWHGNYTFTVNNVTTNTQIASYTFEASKD